MLLQDGKKIIKQVVNIPLKNIFNEKDFNKIVKDKGKTGKLLENAILYINPKSAHLDFTDGELKTNKWVNNHPNQTMSICMLKETFDELITSDDLTTTYPMKKIENWLYVPIDKTKEKHDWFFKYPVHISRDNPKWDSWYKELDSNFKDIIVELRNNCDNGEKVHTITKNYIQIRTKGAGHGKGKMFSNYYNRYVSDVSYAIYLTLDGIKALVKIAGDEINGIE